MLENTEKPAKSSSNAEPKQGILKIDEWVEGGKLMASTYILQLDDKNTDIGLLNLPTFVQDPSVSPQVFVKMINNMIRVGAKKIIVDTRGNGGGYIGFF